jgi:hypothetical protein
MKNGSYKILIADDSESSYQIHLPQVLEINSWRDCSHDQILHARDGKECLQH